jgi:hypothetical protein
MQGTLPPPLPPLPDSGLDGKAKRGLAYIFTFSLVAVVFAFLALVIVAMVFSPENLQDIISFIQTPLVVALTALTSIGSIIGMNHNNKRD